MKPPHLYCPALAPGVVTLGDMEARHALRSLRLTAGDAVVLFDGRGNSACGVLQPAPSAGNAPSRPSRGKAATVRVVVEHVVATPPAAASLTLIVAACKGARLEWLVEKCTELGAGQLILADFEHSVVRAGPQHVRRLSRTALEACKQCGRLWLPELLAGMSLRDAIATPRLASLLVAHPADSAISLGTWLATHTSESGRLAVVVGPEGGLTAEEFATLQRSAAVPVRLSPHVLRVETAAVAVAAAWAAHETGR